MVRYTEGIKSKMKEKEEGNKKRKKRRKECVQTTACIWTSVSQLFVIPGLIIPSGLKETQRPVYLSSQVLQCGKHSAGKYSAGKHSAGKFSAGKHSASKHSAILTYKECFLVKFHRSPNYTTIYCSNLFRWVHSLSFDVILEATDEFVPFWQESLAQGPRAAHALEMKRTSPYLKGHWSLIGTFWTIQRVPHKLKVCNVFQTPCICESIRNLSSSFSFVHVYKWRW
jgi:hypothetical protein